MCERECECMCVRERECVCERERESRGREGVCAYVCVFVRERQRKRVYQ